MAQVAAIQRRTMLATAIIEQKPTLRRMYAKINERLEMVWGLKREADHIVILVWGDGVNNFERISLPLDAELIVL